MNDSILNKSISADEAYPVVNVETYREFIRESEKTFGISAADLDMLSENQILGYIEFLQLSWEKPLCES